MRDENWTSMGPRGRRRGRESERGGTAPPPEAVPEESPQATAESDD